MNVYRSRVDEIQSMFNELHQYESTHWTLDEIANIRKRYGLTEKAETQEHSDANEEHEYIKDEEVIVEYIDENLETENNDEELFEDHPTVDVQEDDLDDPKSDSLYQKPCPQRRKYEKACNEKLYDFSCHLCGEEFSKMQLLSSHCRLVHQTIPQVMCWCGSHLSTWKRLMAHKSRHIKEEDDLKCSICKISYKTSQSLEKHITSKHGPNAEKFVCSQCGKQFKERQVLKNHEKVHLPDELKLKHPCLQCDKKFVNSHCLKIHVLRIHERVALHTCELCGKGCITKSDLKWHMVSALIMWGNRLQLMKNHSRINTLKSVILNVKFVI